MRKRRFVCLLLSLIVMMAMSTTAADAASFNKTAPKGLKATCVNGVSIKVSCKAKKGATGYCFYVATKKGGKYKLASKSKSKTCTVKGLTAGKTYYFKVKAYKGKNKKTYTKASKPVKCKTVLQAPSIAMTDRCDCKIHLKVTGVVGAAGYKIYRSTSPDSGYTRVKTFSGGEWTNTGLNGSTTYYYKVRAYKGSHFSPYSAPIAVTTEPYLGFGNDGRYNPPGSKAYVPVPGDGDNALTGRRILFLGSSITYGSASGGISFPDFIAVRDVTTNPSVTAAIDCVELHEKGWMQKPAEGVVWKEAVSGTTLANPADRTSYVRRLTDYWSDSSYAPDIFACQLSLNDSFAHVNIGLGTLPNIDFENMDEATLDALYEKSTTVGGAIGYVTAFAYYYWPDTQLVFYTVRNNGRNDQYARMRTMLMQAQSKYGKYDLTYDAGDGCTGRNRIEIIDMWGRSELTNLRGNKYCFYMYDDNHPMKAGYLYQWVPVFEEALVGWMPPAKPTYEVEWVDEDGVPLEIDPLVKRWSIPSYDGAVPTKAEDEEFTYEFGGWAIVDDPEEVVDQEDAVDISSMVITNDTIFKAVFIPIEKEETGDDDITGSYPLARCA